MKIIRILKVVQNRVRRGRSFVLCGFGAGLFAAHAGVCTVSWHPWHGLLGAAALLYLSLEAGVLKNARL